MANPKVEASISARRFKLSAKRFESVPHESETLESRILMEAHWLQTHNLMMRDSGDPNAWSFAVQEGMGRVDDHNGLKIFALVWCIDINFSKLV